MFTLLTACLWLGVDLPFLGTAYAAEALTTKDLVEQSSQVMVWDSGPRAGVLDQGDELTDTLKPCVPGESVTLSPQRSALNVADVQRDAATLMAWLKLSPRVLRSTVMDAFLGHQRPVVILLPESHLYASKTAHHVQLHINLTIELLELVARLRANKLRLFNAIEGPQGYWEAQTSPPVAKANDATRWVTQFGLSGVDVISEVYQGEIPTAFVDTPGLNVEWVTGIYAFESKRSSAPDADSGFAKLRAFLAQQGDTEGELIRKYNLERYYRDLLALPPEQLRQNVGALCERRGHEMVQNMVSALPEARADVVLMSFGSLHLHAIREALRARGYGYLVLSPNL